MHEGPALVDERRDSRANAAEIGLEAEAAGDVLEYMRVRVDQPGKHELSGDVDRFLRARGRNRRQDRGDASILERDVVDAVQALRRIDDAPAAKQKVIEHERILRQARSRFERRHAMKHQMCEQRYFDDFAVGEKFVLPSRTMTEALFAAFQLASGDNHPIHYDVEYCRERWHAAYARARLPGADPERRRGGTVPAHGGGFAQGLHRARQPLPEACLRRRYFVLHAHLCPT
jgi:hypothetical protein